VSTSNYQPVTASCPAMHFLSTIVLRLQVAQGQSGNNAINQLLLVTGEALLVNHRNAAFDWCV
jgi:hypothetical protein